MTDIIVEITGVGGATTLTALTDVDIAGGVAGQVLTLDATGKWIPTAASGVTSFAALDDTNVTGVADGYILKYSVANSEWTAVADTSVSHTHVKADITDFVETDYATGAEGDLASTAVQPADNISTLTNDSAFINNLSNESIKSLLDVNSGMIPTNGQVLTFDTTNGWQAEAPSAVAPVDSVAGKTGIVTLVKADITDFVETDYATGAEGDLATSALQNITGESINDLSNVFSTMVPTDGQVLTFDTTNGWQSQNPATGGVVAWGDLTGLLSDQSDLQTALDGKAAVVHTHTEADITDLQAYLTDVTGESVGSLSDVTITGATAGEVLRYNGVAWVDAQLQYLDLGNAPVLATVATTGAYNDLSGAPTVPATLNDLTDVAITLAATGEVLRYDGVNFVDTQLAYADLAGVPATFTPSAHTHVKTDITDFVETDYATGAEGDLASTATQPLDNISTLTNDSGYTNDQTGAEIKTAYELEANTNAFTDTDVTTLSTALQNTVEDLTPQLGGNLDVQTNKIISTGTNDLVLDFADQTGTGGIDIQSGGVEIARVTIVGGTPTWDFGKLGPSAITGLRTPVVAADAAPKSYVDNEIASIATGISNVVEDLSPQLGSDLEAQSNSIRNLTLVGGNANTSGVGFVSNNIYLFTDNGTDILLTDNSLTASTDVKIRNVADPILAQDVATKNYVDSLEIKSVVQTTDVTQTVAKAINIAIGQVTTFSLMGSSVHTVTGDVFAFELKGAIKNIAGTTALVGATSQTIFKDAGAASWAIDAFANDTTDQLEIKVTGEIAHTIDWNFTIRTVEV